MYNARNFKHATSRITRHASFSRYGKAYSSLHKSANALSKPDEIVSKLPTVDNEDGLRTMRRRQHDQKPLPLPPILDPKAIARKAKGKEPKNELEESKMTEFQKSLNANAYAQALASPVRQCSITGARLPTHFLIPFQAVYSHQPDTDSRAATSGKEQLRTQLLPSGANTEARENGGPASQTAAYVLNLKTLLQHLGPKNRWNGIVSQRMKDRHAILTGRSDKSGRIKNEWEWDAATPELVSKALRDDVIQKLQELLAHTPSEFFEFLGLEADPKIGSEPRMKADVLVWLVVARGSGVEGAATPVGGSADPMARDYQLDTLLGDQYSDLVSLCEEFSPSRGTERLGSTYEQPRSDTRCSSGFLKALDRLSAYLHHAPEP